VHYRPIGLLAAVGVLMVLLVSDAPQRAVRAESSVRPAAKKSDEVSLPKGLSPDRWTAIKRDITQRNLDVRELKDGKRAMATPSFRAEFRDEGVHFTSHRETKGLPWYLACQWARLEGDGPGLARVSSEGHVATIETRTIDETFENRIDGVEHVMRVREKDFAGDLMKVRLDVATDLEVVATSDTLVTFRNSEGEDVFEYRGLRVWDSAGKNLEARLEVEGGDILVCVDTAHARFPVTIDPLWRNSNFTLGLDWSNDGLTDRQSLEYDLGFSLCLVGDVTGDGEADLAVGAPGYLGDTGAVFVYYGTGTDQGFDEDIFSIIPSYLGQEGMRWGAALASGLINDDAIPDLVIGAPGYDSANSENCGGVWVLAGQGVTPGFFPPSSQDPIVIGDDVAQAEFGAAVSVPGDLDDDAAADQDVVVGAPGYDSNTGRVYCYFAIDNDPYLDETIQWFSDGPDQAGARFGASLSHFMGDYDGDGDEDLVVGGPGYDVTTSSTYTDAGIVYVFFGTGDDDAFDADPWIAEGPEDSGAQFGFAVDMAGDPNGDGDDDVVIGSPTDDNGGTVYLYFGPPAAPPAIPNPLSISIDGADQLGFSVAGTGADYDADGDDDFLAGAPAAGDNSGRFYVLNYDAAPVDAIEIVEERVSPGGDALFGFSVVGTGDANDDTIADAAAGMPGYWAPMVPGSGGVLAVYDIGAVAVPTQDWLTFISWPDFGWSVAFAGNLSGGDDTANDMYGDVLIGAPNAVTPDATLGGAAYLFLGNGTDLDDDPAWVTYGEGDYGFCVAGVGDVNGDGLPDIMVGDPGYSGTIGGGVGRAYLFLGVTDDLPGTCPDWVSSGEEQEASGFGWSIAGIGSVNNDGYDDVVIGAPEYDDTGSSLINAGRIYVFKGDSSSLLESTPIATYTGLVAWEYFGYSVAGVGDVNGDGDPDVLIGAPYYTSGGVSQYGAVFLFYGGDDDVGLPGTGYSAAGPQAGAFYGFSVSGRVDVNGDDLDDLIVGAPGYNNGSVEDTGRVYVYLGVASGDPFASVFFQNITGLSASTRIGSSVVGVGALPGDAYDDVVAGGPTAGLGMVVLINGGASSMSVPGGLAGRLMATAIAPVPGRFGFSLAAGDVTGDGTPDVIVGAPGPLEPAYVQQAEGVFLFRGED
jgi:hypothetical protein